MTFTEEERSAIAEILETIARDGLPEPKDLDVALDAIQATLADRPLPSPRGDFW